MSRTRLLTINYYTADIDPPYAFNIQARLQYAESGIKVEIEQDYFGREDFSDEALQEEGLSKEDGFAWKGTLNHKWKEHVDDIIAGTRFRKTEDESNVHLKFQDENDAVFEGYPSDPQPWNYLVQELLQACYEKAELELPLMVCYSDQGQVWIIKALFANREAEILKDGQKISTIDWQMTKDLFEAVFSIEPDHAKAKQKPPQSGKAFDPGEQLWYELPNGIDKPQKNQKKIQHLLKTFSEIIEKQ